MKKALVILCGGDSSRMGTDKALLPFKNKTMVEYIYDKFQPHFDKIYFSVINKGDYSHLKLNAVELPDLLRKRGPEGGILSALSMINEEKAFFMSIDTPFMDPIVANYLFDHSDDYDITTYDLADKFPNSVCGIYSKKCLKALGKLFLTRNNNPRYLIQEMCSKQLIDANIINDISKVSIEQQFFEIKDREAYYYAVFSILKNNFTC